MMKNSDTSGSAGAHKANNGLLETPYQGASNDPSNAANGDVTKELQQKEDLLGGHHGAPMTTTKRGGPPLSIGPHGDDADGQATHSGTNNAKFDPETREKQPYLGDSSSLSNDAPSTSTGQRASTSTMALAAKNNSKNNAKPASKSTVPNSSKARGRSKSPKNHLVGGQMTLTDSLKVKKSLDAKKKQQQQLHQGGTHVVDKIGEEVGPTNNGDINNAEDLLNTTTTNNNNNNDDDDDDNSQQSVFAIESTNSFEALLQAGEDMEEEEDDDEATEEEKETHRRAIEKRANNISKVNKRKMRETDDFSNDLLYNWNASSEQVIANHQANTKTNKKQIRAVTDTTATPPSNNQTNNINITPNNINNKHIHINAYTNNSNNNITSSDSAAGTGTAPMDYVCTETTVEAISGQESDQVSKANLSNENSVTTANPTNESSVTSNSTDYPSKHTPDKVSDLGEIEGKSNPSRSSNNNNIYMREQSNLNVPSETAPHNTADYLMDSIHQTRTTYR